MMNNIPIFKKYIAQVFLNTLVPIIICYSVEHLTVGDNEFIVIMV